MFPTFCGTRCREKKGNPSKNYSPPIPPTRIPFLLIPDHFYVIFCGFLFFSWFDGLSLFFHSLSIVCHGFFKELDFNELEIHRYSLMDIHQWYSLMDHRWIHWWTPSMNPLMDIHQWIWSPSFGPLSLGPFFGLLSLGPFLWAPWGPGRMRQQSVNLIKLEPESSGTYSNQWGPMGSKKLQTLCKKWRTEKSRNLT